MVKNFFILILIGLSLACCQRKSPQDEEWRKENGKLKVLTTIPMINDLVSKIGGEDIDTQALIRRDLDPHSYELVKGDDDKFARADILFYNGLGLEHGLSLRQNIAKHRYAVAVTNRLLRENPQAILITDRQYDPHIWLDISLWEQTIDPIVQALSEKDPQHAQNFKQRGELLKKELQNADQEIYSQLQAIPANKRYLVTSHDAFHYFTRRYLATPHETQWEERCRAPEGLAPEAQISVSDIMATVAYIEAFNIHIVFPESNVSQEALKKIVEVGKKKGFKIQLSENELYSDTMGASSSYLSMMQHNAGVIKKGLEST